MTYQERIAELSDEDPRHVEAWMRLQFGTLDHLSAETFADEVDTAVLCITSAGEAESEALAASYGL